jgi:predicted small integral membrane protein
MILIQATSVAGALLILGAFAGLQTRRIPAESYAYQTMNLGGGLALLVVALVERQIGFILLEAAWSIVSMIGLWRVARLRWS